MGRIKGYVECGRLRSFGSTWPRKGGARRQNIYALTKPSRRGRVPVTFILKLLATVNSSRVDYLGSSDIYFFVFFAMVVQHWRRPCERGRARNKEPSHSQE